MEIHDDSIDITVVEIGNKKTQSEQEIGLDSISENSSVSKAGRYFGFGGTSARWGGQVLFFDERENEANDRTWNKIISTCKIHKKTVVNNLLGKNNSFKLPEEQKDIKTGIWLKYTKRNLFNNLSKSELNKIKLLSDLRVVDIEISNGNISEIICNDKNGNRSHVKADIYYLTAGALESCRLLLQSQKKYPHFSGIDLGNNFGDHISTELFHIHNAPPIINGVDFTPTLTNGSLVTKRMVVKTENGVYGFLHGVFNKDIKAFKFLKELLFGKRSTTVSFAEFIAGFVFLFKFVFHLLFKKKLYVDQNQWSLQLDMEQPFPNKNKLSLVDKKDAFGENILQIDWDVSESDQSAIFEIRNRVEKILQENKLKYTPLYNPASTNNKVEDVYHPSGCMRMGDDEKSVVDFNCRINGINNLFHFSTGIFPSAKSINPSAAVLCFIEEHLEGGI